MTETHERWFKTEGSDISNYVKPSSPYHLEMQYRFTDSGNVLIVKEKKVIGIRRKTRYYSKIWGEAKLLKGEDVEVAKVRLSDESKVVKVLHQRFTYRNRDNIEVEIFSYTGPNGKTYVVYRFFFDSEQEARDFNPAISLGKEVTGDKSWSGYPLWKKLVE